MNNKIKIVVGILLVTIATTSGVLFWSLRTNNTINNNKYKIFDNYLWYENKKLFNENLVTYIKKDGEEYDKLSSVEEWFRYEEDNKLFIFLIGSDEVVGFSLKYYLEIDKDKDTVKIQLDNQIPTITSNSYLFAPPYSPDKKKIYFVEFDAKNMESVHVYNWKDKIATKLLDIPKNETLVSCGEACSVIPNIINWIDSSKIIVKTVKKVNGEYPENYPTNQSDYANEYSLTIK